MGEMKILVMKIRKLERKGKPDKWSFKSLVLTNKLTKNYT